MTLGCEYFGGKLQFFSVFYAKNAANNRTDHEHVQVVLINAQSASLRGLVAAESIAAEMNAAVA